MLGIPDQRLAIGLRHLAARLDALIGSQQPITRPRNGL